VAGADFNALFPPFVTQMLRLGLVNFGTKIKAFASPDAVLTGVETRTSSPVRILRNDELQSDGARGLYPCGEGAGYAGGIVSAAVDGVRVAQAMMKRYGASR
ncbi:MAG: FAD-dependent protein, partial [Acetanaerobacterium sp.]